MKVYLIKASAGSSYSQYKAETGGPPQNIFSTAAATPGEVQLEMADETIGMKTNMDAAVDLVAVFMSTPDALRAYEIADGFRARGITVVLGGLHTLACPEEAWEHADTLLLGEVEGVWEDLLRDHAAGTLKPVYQRKTPVDLSTLKPYPTHIIPPSRYQYTWSVVVGRGCPNHCGFCTVHRFFESCRFRPVEDVVEEIRQLKAQGVEWVELHADNLTADRAYALQLFRALAPLKMKLYGETTVLIARDPVLMSAARDAGVKALLFGIETPSPQALESQGKQFVRPEKIKEYIARVKSYGIEVWADFLLGFDAHTPEIFQETLAFIKSIKPDRSFEHLVIPFPGTRLFEELDNEGRILTRDWSQYDGAHVVFTPKQMTPKELEDGTWWLYKKSQGRLKSLLYSLIYATD